MIVSHSQSYIFVAVPKTGSQAIRASLRPHLGPHDWEQCGLFERKRFPVAALAAIGHGHISCGELRPFLLPGMWLRYRKFAFVRDPYQRFRSLVRFWYGDGSAGPLTLDRCKRVLSDPALRLHPLVRPQASFICNREGEIVVDEVGSYAGFAAEFDRIARKLSIPYAPLEVCNASPVPAVELEFDSELRAMIEDFYRDDFRLPDVAGKVKSAA